MIRKRRIFKYNPEIVDDIEDGVIMANTVGGEVRRDFGRGPIQTLFYRLIFGTSDEKMARTVGHMWRDKRGFLARVVDEGGIDPWRVYIRLP